MVVGSMDMLNDITYMILLDITSYCFLLSCRVVCGM